MTRRALVPVSRQVTLPRYLDPRHAEAAVMKVAAGAPVQSITPVATYPGDPQVTVVVTTLEPPKRRHPWHLYLYAVAAVLVAGAILAAALIDVYLLVGAGIFAGFVLLALNAPKDKTDGKA